MPRKDGYETCKDIRKWEKKEKHPHMPIIALSANVMVDVLDKCVSAGFDSYVTKPVDFKELSIAIADLLDPSGKTGSSTDSLGNSPTPSASALAFAKVSRKSGDKKQKEDAK
jgi:CheY-like chemotaxis protein